MLCRLQYSSVKFLKNVFISSVCGITLPNFKNFTLFFTGEVESIEAYTEIKFGPEVITCKVFKADQWIYYPNISTLPSLYFQSVLHNNTFCFTNRPSSDLTHNLSASYKMEALL